MSVGAILTHGLGSFGDANLLVTLGFGSGAPVVPPVVVAPVTESPVAYWRHRPSKRLTEEELLELIRQQRIELGILPPDLPGQAIAEPEDIAEEVAAAVNNQVQMMEHPIDYKSIYRAAYLEAEIAIAEYRDLNRKRKRKRAVALMLLH